MHSANYAVARCLSVCLSHAGILSKRLNISSNFFHCRVASFFSVPNSILRNILMGDLITGALNAGGMRKCDFRPISHFISEMIQDRAIVMEYA